MTAYEPLIAWGSESRELPEEHAREIAATGIVTVTPGDVPGTWILGTDSRVGVLVGESWQISIRPRLDIPRLLFLLLYSLRPEGWKETQAIFEQSNELEHAIAAAFSVHAERALRPGVLHGYVSRDARELTIRGRVRFADQIARSPGLPLPIEITYDEFTPDIFENQLLVSATNVLLRFPRIPSPARTRLEWARMVLDGVEPLADPSTVKMPLITRLNARYENSLVLAELILRRSSIATEKGKVAATSFVFDMNEVFESFLTSRLTQAFKRYGGWIARQRGTALAPALSMRTDITWHGHEGVRAVIDAKYKSLVDQATMPNADAYQMLAYCVALGLQRGYLVYAKESAEAVGVHSVVRHGYEIDARSVDVELPPEELLEQVDRMAADIADQWRASAPLAA